jgi:hypothetical protein
MIRRAVPLLLVAVALGVPASAWASTAITKKQAIAIVRGILTKHAADCNITDIISITATAPSLDRWRVTAKIKDNGYRDTVVWTVVNRKAVPNGPLAAEIAVGCP